MALESLPPDQRAVVQLVLQQGRSYGELAGLLGISGDTVRQRALGGLGTLGGDAELSAEDRGHLSDYLLGQQDEEGQAATRGLLERSAPALVWARNVSEELQPVARHGLPALPETGAVAAGPMPVEPEAFDPEIAEPGAVEPEAVEAEIAEPEAVEPERDAPVASVAPAGDVVEPDPDAEAQPVEAEPVAEPAARRRRRRPNRAGAVPAGPGEQGERTRSSSRLGGAVLLGLLALLAIGAVVFFVDRDDEPSATNTTSTEAAATPTATPRALAQLPLKGARGSEAAGLAEITVTEQGQVGFTLVARNLKATVRGRSAYAIWLVGRNKPPIRLGFGEVLANQGGTLAVQGPEERVDPATFTRGLTSYTSLVVSRETSSAARTPNRPVLTGSLKRLVNGGAADGSGAGARDGK
jgi:hypothetical protein